MIFLSCERARINSSHNEDDDDVAFIDLPNHQKSVAPIKENILSSPIESMLRLFIATVGEFTTFYKQLSTCQVPLMSNIGKIM